MAPMIQKKEAMVAVAALGAVGGAAYYYFARASNPFRPWLLMRIVANKFANPSAESISSFHGVHFVTLKSVKTLIEGIPGKVCPVRTYTFELPDHSKDAVLAETISLGHGDVVKLHRMPTAPAAVSDRGGGHKSYSPTDVSTPGQIDLTIKIYPDGVNSQVFEALTNGDPIGISGPWPPERKRARRLPGKAVNLVAFGVGITEAIEIAKAELALPDAETVKLLYANRYREDAFFKDALGALEAQHEGRFKAVYLYSREDVVGAGERKGRVTAEVLQQVFELPTSADQPGHCDQRFVVPGSKRMIQDTWNKYLKVFDYNRNDHSLLLIELFARSKERSQEMYDKLEKKTNKEAEMKMLL